MSAPATHPCDACDGTGFGDARDLGPIQSISPCLVCLGAGRFPDRMPAKDAVADAETLRLVAHEYRRRPGDSIMDGYSLIYANRTSEASRVRKALRAICPINSGDAVVWSRGKRYPIGQWLARAVFRAVPGLRGEDPNANR